MLGKRSLSTSINSVNRPYASMLWMKIVAQYCSRGEMFLSASRVKSRVNAIVSELEECSALLSTSAMATK